MKALGLVLRRITKALKERFPNSIPSTFRRMTEPQENPVPNRVTQDSASGVVSTFSSVGAQPNGFVFSVGVGSHVD